MSKNIEARIKVAELMGWKWKKHPVNIHYGFWFDPEGNQRNVSIAKIHCPFDPENDANDDVSVLMHMQARCIGSERKSNLKMWQEFAHIYLNDAAYYKIGDYFRAFCAVHNIELENGS